VTTRPLDGRSVVITGAGRGLGRAYALAAAAQGAQVVVNDIDADCAEAVCAEIVGRGGTAVVSGETVATPQGASAIIAACCRNFGGIDALLNNAGLFHYTPAIAVDLAEAAQLVTVNLLGTLYCGVAAMRAMTPDRPGTIINVTSGAALGMDRMSVYAASKAGVTALTATWAIERPNGISVIGLSPIGTTRMTAMMPSSGHFPPEDIAPLAAFLLSSRARALNGATVRLAKGQLSVLRPASFTPSIAWDATWDHARIAQEIARLIDGAPGMD